MLFISGQRVTCNRLHQGCPNLHDGLFVGQSMSNNALEIELLIFSYLLILIISLPMYLMLHFIYLLLEMFYWTLL